MSKRPVSVTIAGVDATGLYMDRRIARVLNAANDLASGHSGDIGFVHSVLCQTFLPCKSPSADVRLWEKTNGHSSMLIEAGRAFNPNTQEWQKLPIPSGTKARLAIIYLSTASIKNKSPVIKLDKSMTDF